MVAIVTYMLYTFRIECFRLPCKTVLHELLLTAGRTQLKTVREKMQKPRNESRYPFAQIAENGRPEVGPRRGGHAQDHGDGRPWGGWKWLWVQGRLA